jgi:hypothetical protein
MNRKLIALLSLAAFSMTGCVIRTRGYIATPPPPSATVTVGVAAPPPPPPRATATVAVNAPQLGAGVQVVEARCMQGAPEMCNGLDDNCNGQIDEGCGYSSGAIQITLAWNTGADIDLYVTDPMGNVVSYRNTHVPSGGVLDHDARGDCLRTVNNTIENVYWDSPMPPPGIYQVEVHYYANCGSAGPTTATTSIAIGGRVVGVYSSTLMPGQRVPVATFQI